MPRPDNWGGYVLVPDRWEFWNGRPDRLHDRFVYEPDRRRLDDHPPLAVRAEAAAARPATRA